MSHARSDIAGAVAVGSLAFQAFTSFTLVIVVVRLLPAAEYTEFSLSVVTAFFFAAAAFEWVRLSVIRHYPGPADGGEAGRLYAVRMLAGIATVLLLGAVGPCLIWAGYRADLAFLIVTIAALQGLTDLQQAIMRSERCYLRFGAVQILRATLLFGSAASLAHVTGRAEMALLGMSGSHLVVLIIGMARRSPRHSGSAHLAAGHCWQIVRYGVPIAAASSTHGFVALALRWAALTAYGGDPAGAAGFSMALDLFQKPFPLLGSMVTSITMPPLFAAYDRCGVGEQRQWMRTILNSLVGLSLFGCFLMTATAPVIADLLVPAPYRSSFTTMAPWTIVYFGLLLNLQTTLALIPQIQKHGITCLLIAFVHSASSIAAIYAAALWTGRPADEALAACMTTAALVAALAITWKRHLATLHIQMLAAMTLAGAAQFLLVHWTAGWFRSPSATLTASAGTGVIVIVVFIARLLAWRSSSSSYHRPSRMQLEAQ